MSGRYGDATTFDSAASPAAVKEKSESTHVAESTPVYRQSGADADTAQNKAAANEEPTSKPPEAPKKKKPKKPKTADVGRRVSVEGYDVLGE